MANIDKRNKHQLYELPHFLYEKKEAQPKVELVFT